MVEIVKPLSKCCNEPWEQKEFTPNIVSIVCSNCGKIDNNCHCSSMLEHTSNKGLIDARAYIEKYG